MKKIKFNCPATKIILLFFSLMILISNDSYAKKISFLYSSVVPAARGYVKVTRDKNGNYIIDTQVSNLAEVNRLQPSRQAYVVWMITDQGMMENLGKLASSTTFMSTKLKASYKTSTSSKPMKIFITAENDAGVRYTNEQIVLSTDRFDLK